LEEVPALIFMPILVSGEDEDTYFTSKRCYPITRLHGVISQKALL